MEIMLSYLKITVFRKTKSKKHMLFVLFTKKSKINTPNMNNK